MSTFSQRLKDLIFQNHKDVKSFTLDFNRKRINGVTITPAAVSNILNKDTECKYPLVIAFAQYFNVSTDYLLGLTDIKASDIDSKSFYEKLGNFGFRPDLIEKFCSIASKEEIQKYVVVINFLLVDFSEKQYLDFSNYENPVFPDDTVLENMSKMIHAITYEYANDDYDNSRNFPSQSIQFGNISAKVSFFDFKNILFEGMRNAFRDFTLRYPGIVNDTDDSTISYYKEIIKQINNTLNQLDASEQS